MRVSQNGRNQLRPSRRARIPHPAHRRIPPRPLLPANHQPLLPPRQTLLRPLVQHPLQGRLGHAQITRAHALVEPVNALIPQHLLDAVQTVLVLPRRDPALSREVLVKLQSRLDHPDRVRRRARYHTGYDGRGEVDVCRVVFPIIEPLSQQTFTVAVCKEVDRAGRDDADEVGAETLEQGARAFYLVHGREDRGGFVEVVDCRAEGVHGADVGGAGGLELGLVKVGLEAGFEDVEGGCEGCCCHAADTEIRG